MRVGLGDAVWIRSEKLELNRDTLGCMINKGDDPDSAIDAFRVFDYHLTHLMGKPNPLLRMFLSAC